jgi:hypothetical protein
VQLSDDEEEQEEGEGGELDADDEPPLPDHAGAVHHDGHGHTGILDEESMSPCRAEPHSRIVVCGPRFAEDPTVWLAYRGSLQHVYAVWTSTMTADWIADDDPASRIPRRGEAGVMLMLMMVMVMLADNCARDDHTLDAMRSWGWAARTRTWSAWACTLLRSWGWTTAATASTSTCAAWRGALILPPPCSPCRWYVSFGWMGSRALSVVAYHGSGGI